ADFGSCGTRAQHLLGFKSLDGGLESHHRAMTHRGYPRLIGTATDRSVPIRRQSRLVRLTTPSPTNPSLPRRGKIPYAPGEVTPGGRTQCVARTLTNSAPLGSTFPRFTDRPAPTSEQMDEAARCPGASRAEFSTSPEPLSEMPAEDPPPPAAD